MLIRSPIDSRLRQFQWTQPEGCVHRGLDVSHIVAVVALLADFRINKAADKVTFLLRSATVMRVSQILYQSAEFLLAVPTSDNYHTTFGITHGALQEM